MKMQKVLKLTGHRPEGWWSGLQLISGPRRGSVVMENSFHGALRSHPNPPVRISVVWSGPFSGTVGRSGVSCAHRQRTGSVQAALMAHPIRNLPEEKRAAELQELD